MCVLCHIYRQITLDGIRTLFHVQFVHVFLAFNTAFRLLFQLSPSTLGLLHQLTTYLAGGDMSQAMAHYTSMVSGSGFAEIAAFMPTVKVLIQVATQLRVC